MPSDEQNDNYCIFRKMFSCVTLCNLHNILCLSIAVCLQREAAKGKGIKFSALTGTIPSVTSLTINRADKKEDRPTMTSGEPTILDNYAISDEGLQPDNWLVSTTSKICLSARYTVLMGIPLPSKAFLEMFWC